MKSRRPKWISISLIICAFGIGLVSCKRLEIPLLITTEIEDITDVTALSGGIISSDGQSEITSCGVCWNSDSTKLYIGKTFQTFDILEKGGFRSTITNLAPNTKYYLKAYATNKAGTGYGQIISFTTTLYINQISFNPSIDYGTLIDQDGNTYKTVTIGSQVWMAENLKVITFKNGEPIFKGNRDLKLDCYTWYNNDVNSNKSTYGVLYGIGTFFNSQDLCPIGWHVPSINEWEILVNYLGGSIVAGAKLKESGAKHWIGTITGITNETGFTALPGGTFNRQIYSGMGSVGHFASSNITTVKWVGTEHIDFRYVDLKSDDEAIYLMNQPYPPYYLSVRCIRD